MGKPTAQRKAEIIQSTLKLATTQGVARLTTQAIAEDVGISHATVFRHFKTRDEIFSASLRWIIENMFANLEPHFTGAEPADVRLQSLIKSQMKFVHKNKGLPRLLFSDRLHMESQNLKGLVKNAMKQLSARLATLIAEGVEQGVFNREVDPVKSAGYLIALFQGLMMRWSIFDFEFPIDEEGEPLWHFFSKSLNSG